MIDSKDKEKQAFLVKRGRVYYNELDPFAAKWLRELIKAGHIAPGEVDERSIEDVNPSDLRGFTQCHFFAGIGVWSYALREAGWPDDREVWTGSCPCQPFSAAGKRTGVADERHLWPALFHLISECRPVAFFGEQVASKDGLAWFDTVQTDLESSRYTVGKADLCAAGFGAPHIRQRLYFVADSGPQPTRWGLRGPAESSCSVVERASSELERPGASSAAVVNPPSEQMGLPRCTWFDGRPADWLPCIDGKARPVEPGTFPLAHGVASRVGRLRGYGNALVAPVAQGFIKVYLDVTK